MVTGPHARWAYAGPPKTGTTSMACLLTSDAFGGWSEGDIHDPSGLAAYPIRLATVRDPFARAPSLYRHWSGDGPGAGSGWSFGRFARDVLAVWTPEDPGPAPFFSAPQWWWLQVPGLTILRLESIGPDLAALGLHDRPFSVPRFNETGGPDPGWYYRDDPGALDAVACWAAGDGERFGDPARPPGS